MGHTTTVMGKMLYLLGQLNEYVGWHKLCVQDWDIFICVLLFLLYIQIKRCGMIESETTFHTRPKWHRN